MPHESELDEDWMEVAGEFSVLFSVLFSYCFLVKGRQHSVAIKSGIWDSST